MILANKVYTAIEFLDLLCSGCSRYIFFDRNVEYTINQIDGIINSSFIEVLWNFPLDEADYLNETHPDNIYVIVKALYDGVPVKRFFQLPSNSAIINEALRNDKGNDKMFDVISHDMRHMYPVPNRDICTLFPDTLYKDTDLADSIIDTLRYCQYDINKEVEAKEKIKEYNMRKIDKVIFNDPATIVFWRDGSKTIVKAQNEPFDKEKGLAMAIAKKVYGNEGNYYNEFKKFIKDEPKEEKNE